MIRTCRPLTYFLPMVLAAGWLVGSMEEAAARDIFVNNVRGDDRFEGRQPEEGVGKLGPVRTLGKALRMAQSGDRIVLAATEEPYRESISLVGSQHSGSGLRDFVIEGNGAVLDGTAPIPAEAWKVYAEAWQRYKRTVFRFRPARLGHQQLYLNGRPAVRVIPQPGAAAPPKLEELEWCLHGPYIYFCVPQDHRPEDYELRAAQQKTGITLVHVRGVIIRDLVVQGFQIDGIAAANTANDILLQRIVARGNGRAGLTVGGASQVTLVDSLLGNNAEAQILTLPYCEIHVDNTQVLGNTAPAWVSRGGRFYLEGQLLEESGRETIEPPPPASNET